MKVLLTITGNNSCLHDFRPTGSTNELKCILCGHVITVTFTSPYYTDFISVKEDTP